MSSSQSQSEYSCGLHLLNMYLTSKASDTSGSPFTFSGIRKSVMRLQALPADRRYCSPLNHQVFISSIRFFETFYRDRGGGIVHEHVLMQRARSFVINVETLSPIVNSIIKDNPDSDMFMNMGPVFAGFLTLAELVTHHANDRYCLDIIAKCADLFLIRCMRYVITPNGGWALSLAGFKSSSAIDVIPLLKRNYDVAGHTIDNRSPNSRRTAHRCTVLHRFFKFFRLI